MKDGKVLILGVLGILVFVVAASGCTNSGNNTESTAPQTTTAQYFENSEMKFQIPDGWNATNEESTGRVYIQTTAEPTAEKPGSGIYIGKDTDSQQRTLEDRANDFYTDGGVKKEVITISGGKGIYVVTQVAEQMRPFEGSDAKWGTVLFDKNGKRYIIDSQEQYPNIFDSTIAPALDTIIKTLQIK